MLWGFVLDTYFGPIDVQLQSAGSNRLSIAAVQTV